MTHKPEVWIIDNDRESWNSVENLLNSIGTMARVYPSAEEFLESGKDSAAGCVLTELVLPGMSGLDLLDRLELNLVRPATIVVTRHATIATAVRALQLGAQTLLEKPCNDLQLLDVIRNALKIAGIARQAAIRRSQAMDAINDLCEGDRQVLSMVVSGVSNKAMAERLRVSVRTVEARRRRVFQRLNAKSLPELVTKCLQAEKGVAVHTAR